MEYLSLAGIIISLALLMILAYRGHSVIWVAPVCGLVVAIFSLGAGLGEGRTLLSTYTVDYMKGTADYFMQWFPAFLLGAIYGKIMDKTGTARALADKLVKLIGTQYAILAVVLPCLLLTYGGISLFVVVFVMYPMGYEIYRAANLPRTLLPSAIAFGAFGITMISIPGTPQIVNLIPIPYFGTTEMAAPLLSIVATILIGVPGYMYLAWRAKCEQKAGHGFVEDPLHVEVPHADLPSWQWIAALVPIVAVFIALNVFKLGIVVALLIAILILTLFNIRQLPAVIKSLSDGALGSITAIMNTSSTVGYGAVVKLVPGFKVLTDLMLGGAKSPSTLLVSESIAVNALCGVTGTASGGLSVALSALGDKYFEIASRIGLNPEYLHRIGTLSTGFGTLPHNGAAITLLAVSHCTHKESFKDIFISTALIPLVVSIVLAFVWGLFV